MGNIETTTKVSRLKSISSIEDNYLEAANDVLKTLQYSQEKHLYWSLFLKKVAGLQACKSIEKRL